MEVAQYQAARPNHVFEYHPPKIDHTEDNFTTLNSFGDDIAGIVLEKTEILRGKKMKIRTDALRKAQIDTLKQNSGYYQQQQYLESEAAKDAQQRINQGFLDRSIRLPADFRYQAAASPKVLVDIEKITRRLDERAALIIDFPLEMVQSSSGVKAANLQGNLRYWNERVKYWINHYERLYKHVLLLIYGDIIQQGLNEFVDEENKRRRRSVRRSYRLPELLKLHAAVELDVEFVCSPITNFANLSELHMRGLMKKKTLAKHAFELYGLPQSEISLSVEPDMMPKPEKASKGKREPTQAPAEDQPKKKKKKKQDVPGVVDV